jgi:hypothetical protein
MEAMRLRELRRVAQVKVLESYRLGLTFDNGLYKEIDLRAWLAERAFGVFDPLLDKDYFAQVELDLVLGTIVWLNGADLCPDVLYAYPEPVEIDAADDVLVADPGQVAVTARELQTPQRAGVHTRPDPRTSRRTPRGHRGTQTRMSQ